MANLITGGLSFAMMSADSSAKAALKPMNMVSRELRKRDPDLELVERAGMYGGNELDKAGGALAKAREELKEAQKAARQEEKAEMEARLEEKREEKAAQREAEKTKEQAVGKVFAESAVAEHVQTAGESVVEDTQSARQDLDMVEISEEAVRVIQERIRMGLATTGDFGMESTAGQKGSAADFEVKSSARKNYLATAFCNKVSKMQMDLKG